MTDIESKKFKKKKGDKAPFKLRCGRVGIKHEVENPKPKITIFLYFSTSFFCCGSVRHDAACFLLLLLLHTSNATLKITENLFPLSHPPTVSPSLSSHSRSTLGTHITTLRILTGAPILRSQNFKP
ncbi:hypothetical protein RIF29_33314 [Crotalaria pallida]|uniref:Uncharacterized protein n=1 Tax=Crotalaria pallida TaxID=3830 RepID=A0AAN9EDJ2_CROPI